MIAFENDCAKIDWALAADLIHQAPLGKQRRDPEKLARAFAASYSRVFALDGSRLIGLGRALCDGEYQAAIYDLAILPQYQGRGLGKEILANLMDSLPVENVILYAAPGREGFYQRCGFRPMLTAMAVLNQAMSAPGRGYLA